MRGAKAGRKGEGVKDFGFIDEAAPVSKEAWDYTTKISIQRAIKVAQELENRLAALGLYLAGSPAEIRDALEKMLK